MDPTSIKQYYFRVRDGKSSLADDGPGKYLHEFPSGDRCLIMGAGYGIFVPKGGIRI